MAVKMGQDCEWQTPADTVEEYRLFKGKMEKLREITKKQDRTQDGIRQKCGFPQDVSCE